MLNPKLLSEAFPVNKVEVFFDSEDHSDFLGFEWEMVSEGKIPIGLDISDTDFNTIGKTGGEKEHTLTRAELPSFNIGIDYYTSGNGSQYISASKGSGVYVGTGQTNNVGGGHAHNNMPPYIVMAFWKRVA